MRKTIMLAVFLALPCLLTAAEPMVKITKLWEYGYRTRKAWQFVFLDAWDGLNYWCVKNGNECGQWDWKAEYYQLYQAQDPCPECNTPEYGDQLVRRQAQQEGIQLPDDLPLPTFSILGE
jgi:hypothetical protein